MVDTWSLFLGFSGMLFAGLLNLVISTAFLARFPTGSTSINFSVIMLGWTAISTLQALLLGLCGWLTPALLIVSSIGLTGFTFICGRVYLSIARTIWRTFCSRLLRGVRNRPIHALLLLIAGCAVMARQLFHIWYLPPYVYDVLVYHLPKVADWVREGRLYMPPSPVLRSWWPANFELLQAWVAVFYHHDAFIELPGLVVYLILLSATFSLLRQAGMSSIAGLWITVAVAVTPSIMMQAVSCKNDLAVAAVYILGLALWGRKHDDANLIGRLFWLGTALAWGVGVKPYLVVLVVGWLPLIAWVNWKHCAHGLKLLRTTLSALSTLGIMVALGWMTLAGYWYVRNAICWGNPLYPVAMNIGPWCLPGSTIYQQGSFTLSSMKETFTQLVHAKLWDTNTMYNPELGGIAGWGWFMVCMGIPLSCLSFFRESWFRRLFVVGGTSFLLLYSSVNPDPWNMRFSLWLPSLLGVGAGCGLRSIVNRDMMRTLMGLSVVMALLSFAGSLGNGYYETIHWRIQMSRKLYERDAFSMWERDLSALPRDAKVAYRLSDNDPVYLIYGPAMTRTPIYLRSADASNLVNQLRSQPVDWYFSPNQSPSEQVAIDQGLQVGALHKVTDCIFGVHR